MARLHTRHRHFVVLEVGRGNLGKGAPRISAAQLCESWNRLLVDAPAGPHFSHGYGHTGNYLLDCVHAVPLPRVVALLRDGIDRQFAVFAATDYCDWVDQLAFALRQNPKPPHGRRATPGAVMELNPAGGIPGLPAPSEKITFAEWAIPRVRAAWKYDILRPDGKALDSTKREGGWGTVAAAMITHAGGRWTARALSTLQGLAKAARPDHLSAGTTTPGQD